MVAGGLSSRNHRVSGDEAHTMKHGRNLALVALAAALFGTAPADAAKKKTKRVATPTVLIVTASEGKRSSLAKTAERRLARIARGEGLRPVVVRTKAKLTAKAIKRAAAVVLAANRGTALTGANEDALNARVRAGGGVVILGSAVRLQPKSQDYLTLVGAQPGETDTATQAEVQFVDKIHPATARLPRRWNVVAPWVSLKKNITGRVHVLGWVDEKSYTPGEKLAMGVEHPVAWCRQLGDGRAVTSTLGLTKGIWSSPVFGRFLTGAIAFAAGRSGGDCGATVWSNWKRTVVDTDITDGTQLDVGPDGRVYYIEHTGSTLKIYDPVKDIVSEAGYIPSTPGLGQGLLGLVVDNNFVKTRWVYMYYHVGLLGRLSRFTLDANDQVDMLSEKVLLTVQNTGVDHNGGGLAMAGNGDLFLAIGANDMPHFDGMYGSRNPTPVVGQATQTDAEITSQNTDEPARESSADPPRGRRELHDPEGKHVPARGRRTTLPEIYTMGHRNAFHVKFDDLTGELLEGDVGPDGREDDPAAWADGLRRVQPDHRARQLRLAVLRRPEPPLQRHQLADRGGLRQALRLQPARQPQRPRASRSWARPASRSSGTRTASARTSRRCRRPTSAAPTAAASRFPGRSTARPRAAGCRSSTTARG